MEPKPTPVFPAPFNNPWVLLMFGTMTGGGVGSAVMRPIFDNNLTKEEVVEIVRTENASFRSQLLVEVRSSIKEELTDNNVVLLQAMDLKIAQFQLKDSDVLPR